MASEVADIAVKRAAHPFTDARQWIEHRLPWCAADATASYARLGVSGRYSRRRWSALPRSAHLAYSRPVALVPLSRDFFRA
jgi:hypothetical protein